MTTVQLTNVPQVCKKLTTRYILQGKVQIPVVLGKSQHVDQERMTDFPQNSKLRDHVIDLF